MDGSSALAAALPLVLLRFLRPHSSLACPATLTPATPTPAAPNTLIAGEPEPLFTRDVPVMTNPTFDATAHHSATLPLGQDVAAVLEAEAGRWAKWGGPAGVGWLWRVDWGAELLFIR